MGTIASTVGAMLLGGVIATFTLVGVIHSQTSAPDKSPVNVDSATIDYGSNN